MPKGSSRERIERGVPQVSQLHETWGSLAPTACANPDQPMR
ncbi:MAG: hypothetical protein WAM79_11595 [Candidatus Sulfotelmatobacter sp.]